MIVAIDPGHLRFVFRVLPRVLLIVCATLIVPATAHADTRAELEKAQSYYGFKDYGRSLDLVGEILETPDLPDQLRLEAQILKARCLTRTGQKEAAKSAYVEALAIDERWRPDPVLQPADEVASFEEALAEHEASVRQADDLGTALDSATSHDCPSVTAPLIATGVFTAATAYFFVAKKQTEDSWNDYVADPGHPTDLYDEYESARSREKVAGAVSIASALVSGYLWFKYIKQNKNCTDDDGSREALSLSLAPGWVVVAYRV